MLTSSSSHISAHSRRRRLVIHRQPVDRAAHWPTWPHCSSRAVCTADPPFTAGPAWRRGCTAPAASQAQWSSCSVHRPAATRAPVSPTLRSSPAQRGGWLIPPHCYILAASPSLRSSPAIVLCGRAAAAAGRRRTFATASSWHSRLSALPSPPHWGLDSCPLHKGSTSSRPMQAGALHFSRLCAGSDIDPLCMHVPGLALIAEVSTGLRAPARLSGRTPISSMWQDRA